jgi:hypothetical protein
VRLSRALRGGVAAICIAGIAAPTIVAPPAEAAASMEVRVARSRDFSRVEFRGAGRPKVAREGQKLIFTFARDADPDLARLRTCRSSSPWPMTPRPALARRTAPPI